MTIRDSCGDPRFLEQARSALADIRKIWGVDEPTQTQSQVSGQVVVYVPDDGRNPPAEVVVRGREEAAKILALNGTAGSFPQQQ